MTAPEREAEEGRGGLGGRASARPTVGLWMTTAALVMTFVASPPHSLAAEPAAEEDRLVHEGNESRKGHDDVQALALLRQAYEVRHSPRASAQLGLVEMALGRWTDAEAHLVEATGAAGDPWVAKNSAKLKQALAEMGQHLGSLEILGSPPGAMVAVDGRAVGALPLPQPVRLRAGDSWIEVQTPGYGRVRRQVTIVARQLIRETIDLGPAVAMPVTPPPAVAATLPTASRPVADAATEGRPSEGGRRESTMAPLQTEDVGAANAGSRRGALRITGVVLAATGGASMITGLIFGAKARSAGEANSRLGATYSESTYQSGRRDQTLEYVGLIAGGALVAGGATCLFLGYSETEESRTHVALVALPGGGGMAVTGGRF
jgi:PEGA domain